MAMKLAALRGPLLLAAAYAIAPVLWLLAADLGTRFSGSFASLTSLGVLLALAGLSGFALNLVLGARLSSVERVLGGLDRMYAAHRVNGQLAFALLLGHAVLVLAARGTVSLTTALDLLRPAAGWPVFAGVLAFSAMTVSIALTLFARLGHEVFVYVQRSFGFAFLLASYHVFTVPTTTAASTALTGYLAVLVTLGVAAFVYRSVLGNVLVRRRRHRVTGVNRLDDAVTEIVMEPVGRALDYEAGQFVFARFRSDELGAALRPFELSLEREVLAIRAGEIRNQFHPFSITSAPGERALRVTVKAVGDYTRLLRRLEPGAEAVVEGPYGTFSHRNVSGRRQVWIAGGIGVTPFLSMARSLSDEDRVEVDFYYCVEHEAEAHFLDELRELAASRDGFRVVLVPRDRDGFLTAARLAAECDLTSSEVLICGPPAMIDSLRSQLERAGVARERIHAEEFGFAKLGRPSTTRDRVRHVPTYTRQERRTLARLGAVAFAGPALAIAIVAGAYAASVGL
jgi:predicted ferric reductase